MSGGGMIVFTIIMIIATVVVELKYHDWGTQKTYLRTMDGLRVFNRKVDTSLPSIF